MSTALVTLPDGKKARITFTDQAQLDSTVNDLVRQHAPHGRNAIESAENFVGEPALQMASGIGASAVGGIKGLARGLGFRARAWDGRAMYSPRPPARRSRRPSSR